MFDLQGKTALVTGASRGIGREVALNLARCGADVALWSREKAGLRAVADEIEAMGRRSHIDAFDVADRDAVETATHATIGKLGKIDVLVVNAGVNTLKLFLEQGPGDWNHMIGTNVFGAIYSVAAMDAAGTFPASSRYRW